MQRVSSQISDCGRSEKPHSEISHRREDRVKSEELVVRFALDSVELDVSLNPSFLRCLVGELFIQANFVRDSFVSVKCNCLCHKASIVRLIDSNFGLQSVTVNVKQSLPRGIPASLKLLQCKLCHKRFKSKLGHKPHEGTHRGIFPHTCPYCGKGFLSSNHLRGHLVDHTGVKEFRCSNCGREFRHAQDLKNHQKRCNQQTEVFSSPPVASYINDY